MTEVLELLQATLLSNYGVHTSINTPLHEPLQEASPLPIDFTDDWIVLDTNGRTDNT